MKSKKKLYFSDAVFNNMPQPKFRFSEEQLVKLNSYGQILLCILAVTGIVTMAVLMPSSLSIIKTFHKLRKLKNFSDKEKNRRVRNTFYYLKAKGLIDIVNIGDDFRIGLTDKGKEAVEKIDFDNISIPKPDCWDGKFWQVAADIPTKYRNNADCFRRKIKKMGLFTLQRTLWFYPFDPRREIELIANVYLISNFVTVMKIEKFDPADKKQIEKNFKERGLI